MNGNDTFLDINNAHLRVNSGNVQASTFVLDQINIVTSANTASTVNFNNVTKAFNAASNIEVGTANLFVDTSTSNVGIGTNAPQDTLHINGGTRISGHILPTVNDTYDLGSAEYKIRHLFLGNTSLWLGDETRITFTGGKMKFRRRKKNALPRGLATIAANRGHTSEQQTTAAALAHAGVSTVDEMKLEHWIDYTKTLDETKEINDIFTEDAADYEATTASEAFKEIGDDIFSAHNVSIGKTTAPTSALDVVGTVKATAFEGDGSALTGIVAGQWTESSGDIYRSSGNVGIGVTNPESVLEVSDTLTNYKIKAVTLNGVPEGGAYYGYILLAKAATGGIDSESYAMGRILARRGSSTSGHKINYYDVVSSRGYNHYETFSVNHVGNRTGNDGFTSTVKVTYNGVVYHALRTGSTGGQPTTDLAFWGASKDAALIMVDSSMISNETSYGHIAFSAVNGNVGIGKIPDAGKKLDVNGTVKATAFEGDGSALTGISGGGQWTYTAGASVGTQQLVFDDQAPGTTFTGTLSGNANNTAIRDTSNRYIRVTQGGTSRIGSVYWQTTLTNNWEATFEIYILPINYGGADDMRFIFYATNPITSNDGATGTNGHGGAYMRWEYYNSDYVELYDHTATAVVSSSASLQMNGWMPVTVTFNNGQLTSTIKNSSGTTLKTTTYDFGTTYSARYNTPTYVAVTGRSGGVQAEDRVRNITINALNVQTADKLTRMNTNIGIDVASPTQKLDVAGTVKATAFEGDGSALTGVTSGQWTDSGGNIYRSSGNVGIGIDPSSSAKFQVSGGKVIFGDVGGYGAAAQDAQVTIGGTHNSSTYYNTNSQVKLLITGGDNDSYSPYYIKCEDENGKDQFYLKGATSDGGSNGILYSRNNVGIGTTTARAGLHAYVQYPIFGKTNTGSGLICDDIGYAKWRQTCGSYHLTFQRHNSSSSTNYTSWTSRGYLHKDYGNTRLNFTGQHRTFIGDVPFTQAESKEGLIVSANSDTYIKMSDGIAYGANAITINECLPVVTLSQTSNDKACFGVISLSEDPETREDAFGTFVSVAEKEKGDTRVFINSVGEGGIWITNKNGTLESGDYVTTSTIPGYGVKQEDDILHNYTVAKITMNCNFNPTLQKVKRIKKKPVDVQYWVHVSNVTVTKEQYDELQPEFRRIIQDADGNDIYQTNDRTEWTHDPVEEDGIETYTEIRNELQNDLDEHGQIQWEDTDDFEKAYKIRYILPDATQISESEYDVKIAAGEEAYKAAFVGCTYHCG